MSWKPAPGVVHAGELARWRSGGKRRLLIETEPGMVIAAMELVPEWPDDTAPILVKVGTDLLTEVQSNHDLENLMRRGRRIILAELRGMGQPAARAAGNRSDPPLGHEVKEALLSLHIGRPLLGQRVTDLLGLLESLESCRNPSSRSGFEVFGSGPAGLAALHAAALDEHGLIRRVTLERSLISWADVVQKGISQNQIGSAVPGVLRYYDLPDLAARLEPMPLTVRLPVDAMNHFLSQKELQTALATCIECYGAQGPLTLQAGP
jgi:hypothetical protein